MCHCHRCDPVCGWACHLYGTTWSVTASRVSYPSCYQFVYAAVSISAHSLSKMADVCCIRLRPSVMKLFYRVLQYIEVISHIPWIWLRTSAWEQFVVKLLGQNGAFIPPQLFSSPVVHVCSEILIFYSLLWLKSGDFGGLFFFKFSFVCLSFSKFSAYTLQSLQKLQVPAHYTTLHYTTLHYTTLHTDVCCLFLITGNVCELLPLQRRPDSINCLYNVQIEGSPQT
jgi:hypothetical protein